MTTPAVPLTHAPAPFKLEVIGSGLAFGHSLGELAEALRAGGPGATAVVQAPPGTGKTTLVPPLLANLALSARAAAGHGTTPRIIVTQPRRVAARSAARRLAALDGSRLGDRVGYTVRGERQTGPGTLIEFVTPGILLNRLLADPGLETAGAVILDEVHERGLETDLLLGMLTEVRQLRGRPHARRHVRHPGRAALRRPDRSGTATPETTTAAGRRPSSTARPRCTRWRWTGRRRRCHGWMSAE